jgi:hypothetical protein
MKNISITMQYFAKMHLASLSSFSRDLAHGGLALISYRGKQKVGGHGF